MSYLNSQIPSVQKQTSFKLKDLLDLVIKQTMLDLNCHAVGKIVSFNKVDQTAEVEMGYTKVSIQQDKDGNFFENSVNYPILIGVPVVIMSGGGGSLTFPIEKGDSCLILFNDRDFGSWFSSGGQVMQPSTPSLHSLSSGVALVGLRHLGNSIEDYDDERALLKKGAAKVGVGKDDKVLVSNDLTTLKEILSDLITALNTAPLIQTTGAPGAPSSINPAITALLASVTIKINNLLE